jgi:hypothetical protein
MIERHSSPFLGRQAARRPSISRRNVIALLGASAAAWPLAARAQQDGRVRRIGVLMYNDDIDPTQREKHSAFTQSLAAAGWHEGRNLRIDVRWAIANVERGRLYAKELVAMQPDVIVVESTALTAAFQRETKTIPNCICWHLRPGRLWLRRQPPPPGRESHRLHQPGSRDGRQVAGAPQRGRAGR